MRLSQKLSNKIMGWLSRDVWFPCFPFLSDFDKIKHAIKPGDVLLVEGRSRISKIIGLITHSPWSHVALYIGYLDDIQPLNLRSRLLDMYQGDPKEQLFIESILGRGVVVTPLSTLRGENVRVCRPKGLSAEDAARVIAYSINVLGYQYDTGQIFDLARLLFPWHILPRRWRSNLFTGKAGVPTKLTCSLLLAEAFSSVDFPILPYLEKDAEGKFEFVRRHPQLFTPGDFDCSPFFEIIKFPIVEFTEQFNYHDLSWKKDVLSDNEGNFFPEAK